MIMSEQRTDKGADKELSEKVAKYLGYKLVSDCWWEKLEERPHSNKIPDYELEKFIFSWPVSGVMIEKMDEYSWALQATNNCFSFREWFGDCWDRETNIHSINKTCNYHKSIALAFCDAMKMINELPK